VTVQVVLPGVLADLAGGERHLVVPVPDGPGATVGDVLDRLAADHPTLARRIRDETGAVRRFVNVYVDGEDVRFQDGVRTRVEDGAVLQVLPSVAGG
jgi:molybdopterin synthase sulfur carrier subunit